MKIMHVKKRLFPFYLVYSIAERPKSPRKVEKVLA